MDDFLEKTWLALNENFFENSLQPLTAIDWGKMSGADGFGAYGRYYNKSRCIVIDEKFRVTIDEDGLKENSHGNKRVALGLLLHEMVHQSLHEKGAPFPGQHGASFFEEALRIDRLLGSELPPDADMTRWPFSSPPAPPSMEYTIHDDT